MSDIEVTLESCFSTVFPELGADEVARASIAALGAWDSLATINLVAVIEESFSIRVAPEDLELLISYDLILDYLKARTQT